MASTRTHPIIPEETRDGHAILNYCPSKGYSTAHMVKIIRKADQQSQPASQSQPDNASQTGFSQYSDPLPVSKKRKSLERTGVYEFPEIESDSDDHGSVELMSSQSAPYQRPRPKDLLFIPDNCKTSEHKSFGLCGKEIIHPLSSLRPIVTAHVSTLPKDERCITPTDQVAWPAPDVVLTARDKHQKMKDMKDSMDAMMKHRK